MNKRARGFAMLLALLLAACGGSDDKAGVFVVDCDQSANRARVGADSFEVTGTSAPLVPVGAQPINAAENDGRFSVQWQSADGVDGYGAAIVASKSQGDENDDIEIGRFFCSGSACAGAKTIQCQYRSDNTVRCGQHGPVDLTNWFDQLPQDADLAIVHFNSCGANAQFDAVQFQ